MREARQESETKFYRPLGQVAPVADHLVEILGKACVRLEVGGSIRRLRPSVGDIELVAIPKIESYVKAVPDPLGGGAGQITDHNFLWAALDGLGDRVEWIRKGDKARAFWYPLEGDGEKVKVDLWTATPENWGLIHLIRTGSDAFAKDIVTRLARARRPSFEGHVRDAAGCLPDEFTPGGMPKWSDARKAKMPRLPTPEEADVFRLAMVGALAPADRSWKENA